MTRDAERRRLRAALVVDDSAVSRHAMVAILRTLGFETVEAVNGREGLELLDSMTIIEAIFVEWCMPVMDGIAFVLAARAYPRRQLCTIVIVSAKRDINDAATALEVGADEYLTKPFDLESVRSKLVLMGLEVSER